ncbi:MAG: hypothetical protein JSW58_07275 [Candidatus Latescibacterota bacterium]|nr:MAG: hypothetical protein JSW58_07275 [Candidatus Latescibacterota bacterium]
MRVREASLTFAVLAVLVVSACNQGVKTPTTIGSELNSGSCAGCLLNSEGDLFSYVVRTEADFRSLTTSCFPERIKEEWLPPRPVAGQELVYVSLKGGGCEGCLDIVRVRETFTEVEVEVEGGFQGECEMLIVLGAWALIPRTDKQITFQLRDVTCPDDL